MNRKLILALAGTCIVSLLMLVSGASYWRAIAARPAEVVGTAEIAEFLRRVDPPTDGSLAVSCSKEPVAAVGELFGSVVYLPRWIGYDYSAASWDHLHMLDARRSLASHSDALRRAGHRFPVRFGHQPFDGIVRKDGSTAPGYDWKAALEPGNPQLNIDDYMAYVEVIGADPQVVINFGSSTAAQAADLVAYANGTDPADPMVALRMSRGHEEPYAIPIWEIGNEQYGGWALGNQGYPDGTSGSGSADPRSFGIRAAEFADAMRSRSPSPVRILAPLENWELNYYGHSGMAAVVRATSRAVDGYVIHYYPEPGTRAPDPTSMLGTVDILEERLGETRSVIDTNAGGRHLELAVTEWAPTAFPANEGRLWSAGLLAVDGRLAMARQSISTANYFAAISGPSDSGSYSYFANGDPAWPSPALVATELLARHTGGQVLETTVSGSPTAIGQVPVTGVFDFPRISALCTGDAREPGQLSTNQFLVMVNRGATPETVNVSWPSVASNSASLQISSLVAPPWADDVEMTTGRFATESKFSVTLPPWSASFLASHASPVAGL